LKSGISPLKDIVLNLLAFCIVDRNICKFELYSLSVSASHYPPPSPSTILFGRGGDNFHWRGNPKNFAAIFLGRGGEFLDWENTPKSVGLEKNKEKKFLPPSFTILR
jgi:hypothetical protein